MTVMEEVNELVIRMIESGIDLPDSILLGIGRYNQLNKETDHSHRYMGGFQPKGYTPYSIWTVKGKFTIALDPAMPYYHLSIGRMTLDDFIIEDILFNENLVNTDSIN